MEKKQGPNKPETTNDRRSNSLLDVEEKPTRPGEEPFDKADDDDELSFDIPRD